MGIKEKWKNKEEVNADSVKHALKLINPTASAKIPACITQQGAQEGHSDGRKNVCLSRDK